MKDVAGLAVMRTVAMLVNEAADAVDQGVCSPDDLDLAMEKGVNYPIGPLKWADEAGVALIQGVLTHSPDTMEKTAIASRRCCRRIDGAACRYTAAQRTPPPERTRISWLETTVVQPIPKPEELEPIETREPRRDSPRCRCKRLRGRCSAPTTNVPHYRQRLRRQGRAAGRSQDSWPTSPKFPFTVKSDLRDNYPFGMFAVPREQVARIHASSGTTGKPTVVGYTAEGHRHLGRPGRALDPRRGRRAGDLVHIAYGYGLFTGGLGRALRRRARGLHRRPDVGRPDREAGAADPATSGPTSSWSRRATCR